MDLAGRAVVVPHREQFLRQGLDIGNCRCRAIQGEAEEYPVSDVLQSPTASGASQILHLTVEGIQHLEHLLLAAPADQAGEPRHINESYDAFLEQRFAGHVLHGVELDGMAIGVFHYIAFVARMVDGHDVVVLGELAGNPLQFVVRDFETHQSLTDIVRRINRLRRLGISRLRQPEMRVPATDNNPVAYVE